jgi:hypothetical protein
MSETIQKYRIEIVLNVARDSLMPQNRSGSLENGMIKEPFSMKIELAKAAPSDPKMADAPLAMSICSLIVS